MRSTAQTRTLASYFVELGRHSTIDPGEERTLFREVEAGVSDALDRLVTGNLGFVVHLAREYASLGLPFEDLVNEGNIGLVEAARRFDPSRGNRFTTYAVWWIRKSILKAVADNISVVRVPALQAKQLRQVRDAERRLRTSLGRQPSRPEIAESLSMTEPQLDKVLRRSVRTSSLDEPLDESGRTLEDSLADARLLSPQRSLEHRDDLQNLARAYRRLSRAEQRILAFRFGLSGEPPKTLAEVGRRVGLSRERVRQIEKEARRRLSRWMSYEN